MFRSVQHLFYQADSQWLFSMVGRVRERGLSQGPNLSYKATLQATCLTLLPPSFSLLCLFPLLADPSLLLCLSAFSTSVFHTKADSYCTAALELVISRWLSNLTVSVCFGRCFLAHLFLHRGGYVLPMSICGLVGLSARLYRKTDFDETWIEDGSWTRTEPINFWRGCGYNHRYRKRFSLI